MLIVRPLRSAAARPIGRDQRGQGFDDAFIEAGAGIDPVNASLVEQRLGQRAKARVGPLLKMGVFNEFRGEVHEA